MKNLLNTEVVAGFVTSCRRCDFPLHIVAPCVAKGATICNVSCQCSTDSTVAMRSSPCRWSHCSTALEPRHVPCTRPVQAQRHARYIMVYLRITNYTMSHICHTISLQITSLSYHINAISVQKFRSSWPWAQTPTGTPSATSAASASSASLHFMIHTWYSTLYTALYAPHSILYTPHSTLHTKLYTPHSHSTLYTLHLIFYTSRFTLDTPHSTLHSTLQTLEFPLCTLHSTLCTLHSTLCTLHCTLSSWHPTLCTLHSTLYSSSLYT